MKQMVVADFFLVLQDSPACCLVVVKDIIRDRRVIRDSTPLHSQSFEVI